MRGDLVSGNPGWVKTRWRQLDAFHETRHDGVRKTGSRAKVGRKSDEGAKRTDELDGRGMVSLPRLHGFLTSSVKPSVFTQRNVAAADKEC